MRVGFIGLGRMGSGMAGRILSGRHDLLVYDPVPGQTTPLEEAGALFTQDCVDGVAAFFVRSFNLEVKCGDF